MAQNYFIKSEIKNGELKLYFDSDIDAVKYLVIPIEDGYTKFVYDIYGAVLPSGKGISHHSYKDVKSFRIAQNSKDRVRVVIISKLKSLGKHNYKNNILTIPLNGKDSANLENSNSNRSLKVKEPSLASQTYSDSRYVVVIDPGHGGKDNGASCCRDRIEKRLVLSVAKRLKRKLKSMGYRVYMTRSRDVFVKLPKRTAFANRKKADIFVSIHANASPSMKRARLFRGIEVYYLSPASSKRAKEAAIKENNAMLENKDYYTKNAFLSILIGKKL